MRAGPRPKPRVLAAALVVLVLALASSACFHSAEFRRVAEGPIATTVVMPIERPVRIDVSPFQGGPQFEKHALFLQALRDDPHVQLISTAWTRAPASEDPLAAAADPSRSGGGVENGGRRLEDILRDRAEEAERRRERAMRDRLIDYQVTYTVRVETSGRGVNFPICFPGFLIFMPAWYGLTWEYSIVSRADIQRADGAFVGAVDARDEYICYYTAPQDGVNVNMGFTGIFPFLFFGFIYPFTTGITSSVGGADLLTLDQAFLGQEGKAYGETAKARVLERIARDLRGEPVDGVLPAGGPSPAVRRDE